MYMYINANISNVTDVVEQECPPFRRTRAHPGCLVGFVFFVSV